ncbi:hypothetical protein L1887_35788 [Cichorium endivia]|nr:hypothetical protein L1887_35788 [Cichorium endivia]
MGGGEGREGDWECNGCRNRNYAFRSFCNRCKQPRLLVDPKSHADSKWLPRIGDWICSGCTNNNYASREKCKKCGEPKEVAALPAHAMSYFPQGLLTNGGLPLNPNWLLGGPEKFALQTSPTWPLGGNSTNTPNTLPYINQVNQVMASKGWRNGDWICTCGFHNYASRAQCKKCNASMPPALGTKRLASEELVQDWDNKRLNAGQRFEMQNSYQILSHLPSSSYSQMVTMPALPGKGAKQWREGDWMCTNCHNHNYASRSKCNKCNTQREGPSLSVGVA